MHLKQVELNKINKSNKNKVKTKCAIFVKVSKIKNKVHVQKNKIKKTFLTASLPSHVKIKNKDNRIQGKPYLGINTK